MRLGTVDHRGGTRAAVFEDDGRVLLLDFRTAAEAIAHEVAVPGSLKLTEPSHPVDEIEITVLAPLLAPGKILGSGINYRSHQVENPRAIMPVEPGFFSKFPSSVVGPGAAIVLPAPESQVDYEVELAIVIGVPGRNIRREDAFDHVFGYTLVNDISGRDVQFRPNQMDLGKGFDTFCPLGPWIVTRDEIVDPNEVRVRSWVNGDLRQDASTSEWIYDVPALIEHASRFLTLHTGDVITTGTPAGCGTFREPPIWLRGGDEVVIAAEGIGELRNHIVNGW